MAGDDYPSIGLMIEQANGVGITSAGTHADGVTPRALGNGLWQARVTFTALALHTGVYELSVYLFDAAGLVVYEEWPDCARFLHVYGRSTPGLVRLPHVWS
jgi:lipopolysaccharide transport system ATP-binding protein